LAAEAFRPPDLLPPEELFAFLAPDFGALEADRAVAAGAPPLGPLEGRPAEGKPELNGARLAPVDAAPPPNPPVDAPEVPLP
jgi:hypothetical protein